MFEFTTGSDYSGKLDVISGATSIDAPTKDNVVLFVAAVV
jgi:hypothetical protein